MAVGKCKKRQFIRRRKKEKEKELKSQGHSTDQVGKLSPIF